MNILLIKVYDFCIEDICKAVRFYSHETIHCECTNEEILSLAKKHDVHVFTIDPNIDIPSWTTSDIDAPAKYNT